MVTRAADSRAQRGRLGRGEWIRAAFHLLAEESIESVRVEPLAKRLGVTKGSFYWHFNDRDELLIAMLHAWHQAATQSIIERVDRQSQHPADRLRGLLREVVVVRPLSKDIGGLVELGIRDWARRDRKARAHLESVDSRRLAYIEDLFVRLGCSADEAEARAFLVYAYIQGELSIRHPATRTERLARAEWCADRMLSDLPIRRVRVVR
jgi:AcrR family transcriptional regulator